MVELVSRIAKTSLIRDEDWTHHRDGILVSVANPADVDHGVILSQKLLVPQPEGGRRLAQHGRGSDLSLGDSEADDERPQSPPGSFVDEDSDSDPTDPERESGTSKLMESHTTETTEPDDGAVPASLTRPTRIRFRSRVRITSGLNRRRQSFIPGADSKTSTLRSTNDGGGYFCYTPSSSISGSPSSSISAPLRSRTDDEADRPGWGPLGQRVNMFAKKDRIKKRFGSTSDDGQSWTRNRHPSLEDLAPSRRGRVEMTEASPLLTASQGKRGSRVCPHGQRRKCYCVDCSSRLSMKRTLSPDEMDQMFGSWPGRILNYQVFFPLCFVESCVVHLPSF